MFLAVREWRHLKLLQRAGRGHDPAGIEGTEEGSLAVECPACPQPGRNLPDGWEKAPPDRQYVQSTSLPVSTLTCYADGFIRCIFLWTPISSSDSRIVGLRTFI